MQELRLLYFFLFPCIISVMRITKEKTEHHLDNYLWGSCETDAAVNVALSHDDCVLHALFDVREKELRRMVWDANGPVWTDSCVEIFIKNRNSREYSNFEFSASGAFLACHGEGRKDRIFYSDDERSAVTDSVSILENSNKSNHWILSASIDLRKLGVIESTDDEICFNIYKCGDGLKKPHFISLFPISLPSPDFHCPTFFTCARLV